MSCNCIRFFKAIKKPSQDYVGLDYVCRRFISIMSQQNPKNEAPIQSFQTMKFIKVSSMSHLSANSLQSAVARS
jgi:hypothetical protein